MPKVLANNVALNVFDEGAGRPLLFVHGFPLDHSMWQGQLAEFARTHRVIAPDLCGFGSSGVVAGTRTMEQFADDLAALLDALHVREPVTFCGLSMGGYIAWAFVEKFPERVRSLILCDTRAVADTPEASRARLKTADDVVANGPLQVADSMLPKLFCQGTFDRAPQVAAEVRQIILQTDREGIAAALRGMATRPDRRSLLSQIKVASLVVVGNEDVISPPVEMREIASTIPQATFVEVPNAGHMSPLENPAVFNMAVRQFLLT